jgi:rhodanese-related sulfurtransferase
MEKKQLSGIVLLLVVLFTAATGINKIASAPYKLNNVQIAGKTANQELFLSYEALHAHIKNNSLEQFILADIRTADAFASGHLEQAVNIPMQDLPSKQARRILNKKKPILLYAEEEHQAAAAQLILFGMGYEKVQYIPGGFQDISAFVLKDYRPSRAYYRSDKARFDFPRFIRGYETQKEAGPRQPFQIPAASPPATAAGGGC